MRLVEGERAKDNVQGWLARLCSDAGFDRVAEVSRFATLFGTLSLYRARKPPR